MKRPSNPLDAVVALAIQLVVLCVNPSKMSSTVYIMYTCFFFGVNSLFFLFDDMILVLVVPVPGHLFLLITLRHFSLKVTFYQYNKLAH